MSRLRRRSAGPVHPWTRPLRLVPLAAAVAIAVVASGLANRNAAQQVAEASAFSAVLGEMEAHFAVSHIRVEEKIARDPTVDVGRDIEANQVYAARLCGIVQRGGQTEQGHVDRIDDARVETLAARMCQGIAHFRALTVERLARPRSAEAQAGSAAETRYDQVFAAVLDEADAMRSRLGDIGTRERRQMQLVQGVIVLVLLGLVVAAGVLIRRRDRQLAVAARQREGVLQSAGEGIVAVDADGALRFVNAAAAQLLGWRPDELLGRPVSTLLPPEDRDHRPLPGWMRAGQPIRLDDRDLVRRDGSRFPIAYHLSPPGTGEHGDWLVLTFENIESRRLQDSLRDAELAELRMIKDTLVPPAVEEVPGLELSTCHEPAHDGVAGDFFLVTAERDDRTVIVVGDVAGKGVMAARRAAYVRTALATFAPYADSPSALLDLGNRSLLDATGVTARFVTAVCLIVEPSQGRVTWASAGHPAPIRLDTGAPLDGRAGLPLGLSADLRITDHSLELSPGDGLLVYTDGLSEARRADLEQPELLGPERVAAELRRHAGGEPEAVASALRELAERHSEGQLADDLCMITLRIATDVDMESTAAASAVS